jgi:putative protease
MNREAKVFFGELLGEENGIMTASLELSSGELKELSVEDMNLVVYGRIPLMVSAHCVKMTMGGCTKGADGKAAPVVLTDRVGKKLFVKQYCDGCYNVLYNPECLFLTEKDLESAHIKPYAVRYDFTFETGNEVRNILSGGSPEREGSKTTGYTRGHFRRGVE